jgi:hypothetical protein
VPQSWGTVQRTGATLLQERQPPPDAQRGALRARTLGDTAGTQKKRTLCMYPHRVLGVCFTGGIWRAGGVERLPLRGQQEALVKGRFRDGHITANVAARVVVAPPRHATRHIDVVTRAIR